MTIRIVLSANSQAGVVDDSEQIGSTLETPTQKSRGLIGARAGDGTWSLPEVYPMREPHRVALMGDEEERRRGAGHRRWPRSARASRYCTRMMRPGMIGPREPGVHPRSGGLAIAAGDSLNATRRAYLAEVERRAERSELERELLARRRGGNRKRLRIGTRPCTTASAHQPWH